MSSVAQLPTSDPHAASATILAQAFHRETPAGTVYIRDRHGLCRVRMDSIHCIRADGNYVELLCDQRRFVLRTSLREMLLKFGMAFVQVNRHTAVNVQRIQRVDCDSVTVEGSMHPLGRNFRGDLLDAITVLG